MSEIDNLMLVLTRYFNVSSSNITLMLAVVFTLACSYLVLNKTNNAYAGIAAAFIPISIFTIFGVIPIIVYALIAVSLSFIMAAKIVGVI